MGMGNYASMEDVVEDSFVQETCPDEYKALLQVLDECELSLDIIGQGENVSDVEGQMEMEGVKEEDAHKIFLAYEKVCETFQERTELSLWLSYHEKQDRGDEVDGAFWCVGQVYILSPAGKKYKDKINKKSWTVFG